MEGDPTSSEEAKRSAHSSKWLESKEDEMSSMRLCLVQIFKQIRYTAAEI
jgi:hypothetical protein